MITEPAVSSGHEAAFFFLFAKQLAIMRWVWQLHFQNICLIVVVDALFSIVKTQCNPGNPERCCNNLLPIANCVLLFRYQ
ncbi:hypothetical protein A3860_37390 [Niastella vici]|uniref:Uncharacterized protein n=1 Tax=Niastella vici TaxID=1703345 RepID=A0A1V9FME0_9BACT|nr:hypothetical protein [Niastella vici]OQP59513.1 hypothetical protein A3860_37390 [Niastella vici]